MSAPTDQSSVPPPPALTDRYDGVAQRWGTGAVLVYGPLAAELVGRSPHSLAGHLVLDVGAGTGVGSHALQNVGARCVALDLSHDMLSWRRSGRPPCVVAGVQAVPVSRRGVDDVFASFVLNHVPDPVAAIRELARTVAAGGAFLATTFANDSVSAARDRIDQVALDRGWLAPDWYIEMKASIVPLLGSRESMARVASDAGLDEVVVDECAVDVGVHRAEQLVDFRFGQAHISEFLSGLSAEAREELRVLAIEAVGPAMEPYRPGIVFLSARVP